MSKKSRQRHQKRIKIIQSGDKDRALATATPSTPIPNTAANNNNPYQATASTPPQLQSGRQTQPVNANPLGMFSYAFLPRRQYQDFDLTDLSSLGRGISAQQFLEMLADLSPEVSLALSNKVLLNNTGWYYKVMKLDGTAELKRAKAMLDVFLEKVNKDSGGVDAVIDSWAITCFLQGAIAGELVLNEDLSDALDIVSVQPWSIHFERDVNQALVPFQQQVAANGGNGPGFGVAGYPFKRLNPATFGYIPFQAPPDDPYGRPPAAPVLQLIVFDLQLLKDIRQAVHQNAWGRTDVTILGEALAKQVPKKIEIDPVAKQNWINDRIAEIKSSFNSMKADDSYVHMDSVTVTSVDSSGKMLQIDAIVRMLERRLIRSLKEMPVLMGSNEGTTETHGTVQMDIYAKFIASIQKTIANLLEKLLAVALQVWGIAGKVIWEFEPVRATDRLADAQADQVESSVLVFQRDQGWIDNDTAAMAMTGHKAVAEPKAQVAPLPDVPVAVADKPAAKKGNNPADSAASDNGDGSQDGSGTDDSQDSQSKSLTPKGVVGRHSNKPLTPLTLKELKTSPQFKEASTRRIGKVEWRIDDLLDQELSELEISSNSNFAGVMAGRI
jgi:hypothetical protein